MPKCGCVLCRKNTQKRKLLTRSMLWDHAFPLSSISDNIFHCLCRLLVEGRLSSPQEVYDSIMLLEAIQPKNLDSYWKVYVYTKVVTVCILALERTKNPETLLELANKVLEFMISTGINIVVGHSHNTSSYNFVNNHVVLEIQEWCIVGYFSHFLSLVCLLCELFMNFCQLNVCCMNS